MTRVQVPIALLVLSLVVTGSAMARAIDPARSTVADAARLNTGGTAIQLVGVMHCPSCRSFTLGGHCQPEQQRRRRPGWRALRVSR